MKQTSTTIVQLNSPTDSFTLCDFFKVGLFLGRIRTEVRSGDDVTCCSWNREKLPSTEKNKLSLTERFLLVWAEILPELLSSLWASLLCGWNKMWSSSPPLVSCFKMCLCVFSFSLMTLFPGSGPAGLNLVYGGLGGGGEGAGEGGEQV